MIQERTTLNIADNSGARCVMHIEVLGGSYRRYAGVGNIAKITIKETILRGKAKEGDAPKTVVVRIKKGVRRPGDSVTRFDDNVCIPLNNNSEQPTGTYTFGPVTCELRSKKFMEIISLAPEVF